MATTRRPEYQWFLQRLREARVAAGLTQVEVARKLRRHQSYVSKCESGERRLDPVELAALARLYGKPVKYFLRDRPEPRSRHKG